MSEMLETIATSGVFAVLFFILLMVEISDSRNREARYQNVIERLTDELGTLEDVDDNVEKVLDCVRCMRVEGENEETK